MKAIEGGSKDNIDKLAHSSGGASGTHSNDARTSVVQALMLDTLSFRLADAAGVEARSKSRAAVEALKSIGLQQGGNDIHSL